ncbi:ABC transporter permease [uncultured Arsenicicoccus sp.]|uniref:ABC transporter permease n=1 Tax=uncultured Arsenicicoccus sp. TaxID=491339 RepID=UPI0025925ABF|nr:ABC transporter permease [uncultured Arsenicicoccus sp.]
MPTLPSLPAPRDVLRAMGGRASFVRLVVVTIAIFVTFSLLNPGVFLSGANFQYIFLSAPELTLLSLAMSLTMLTAGIDLSVVGISNVAAIVAAQLMLSGTSVSLAVLAALVVGACCGLLNAALVAGLRVPPILATLGTQQLFTGLALVLSGGTVLMGLPASFTSVALTTVAGVPLIFEIMLLIALVVAIVTNNTTLGFRMRLVGANPKAADYSGIRRGRVLMATYLMSGVLAGVAGLIISSRASGANSQYGTSYILLAIVVAVLAGVNPDGGYLTVAGVVISVLALQMLATGLLSLQDSPHVVNIAQGALLIVMVLWNTWGSSLVEWRRSRREAAVAA